MTGITTASIIKASYDAGLYIATAAADRIDMFENLSAPNEVQYVCLRYRGHSARLMTTFHQGHPLLWLCYVYGFFLDGGVCQNGRPRN